MSKRKRERAVKEVKPDGTLVLMSRAEESKWRKSIKTVIRNRARRKAGV
jgi:hypothetical protein